MLLIVLLCWFLCVALVVVFVICYMMVGLPLIVYGRFRIARGWLCFSVGCW